MPTIEQEKRKRKRESVVNTATDNYYMKDSKTYYDTKNIKRLVLESTNEIRKHHTKDNLFLYHELLFYLQVLLRTFIIGYQRLFAYNHMPFQ